MTAPRVSVIVPNYRQGWFLPHALDSIARQSFTDFELIVVDDGSDDDSVAALTSWCRRNNHRARPFRLPENLGTAAAINAGIDLAQGELLTWASSDNLMSPHWLARLVREIDAGAGCAYGGFWYARVASREEALSIAENPCHRPSWAYLHEPYAPGRQIAQEACYLGPAHLIRREVWAPHTHWLAHDLAHFLSVEEACWERGLPIVGVDEPLCTYLAGDWRRTITDVVRYDAPAILAEARKRRAGDQ